MHRTLPRCLTAMLVLASALLGGCATTIRSDVTTFHEWPGDLTDKSFSFNRSKEQDNDLQYRNYENLVRDQLVRLGFAEAAMPALKVAIDYDAEERVALETRLQPVDPFMVGPYGNWGPGFGPRYGRFGPGFGPRFGPYYDPWYSVPVQVEVPYLSRHLQIVILRAADGKMLYQTDVDSDGREASLSQAMPYMVRSAFSDFPGRSGEVRQVTYELDKPKK